MSRRLQLLLPVVVLCFGFSPAPAQAPDAPARTETEATLNRYCLTCHNAKLKTAGLVLDPAGVAQVGATQETWEKVLHQLRGSTMPPPGATRPDAAVYNRITAYLTRELEQAAAAKPNPGDLSPVHRLTRTEYRNAIRDVLALSDLPKEMDYATLLPADNNSSGFDNLADTLFVSPVTMERYLDSARKISRLAVGDPNIGLLVNIHLTPVRQPQEARNDDLPFGTRGGVAVHGYFPLDGEYEFQVQTAGAQRDTHQLEITVDGERKGLVPVRTGGPAPTDDLETPPTSTGAKFRFSVKAGPRTVGVAFIERSEALSESPLRPPGRSRGALPSVVTVTITGPYNPQGPGEPPSRQRIFVCKPGNSTDELPCAKRVLSTLARRAYRRNVTDADLKPLLQFYDQGHAQAGFETGIERAIERLLVSPQFLFRIEREPAGAAPGTVYPISDFELASRLSFFLWSSIPDDTLLDVAASGKLRDPAVMQQQVARMLADPKSESLVTNFAAQWLYLRDVEMKDPDLYVFRDFDEGLRAAFVRETEFFVNSILRENRSVLDLLTANYTYLNERLARQYNIPNVTGSYFRRVTLPPDSPRAGLLGQGSVLMLTAYTTRTSAVLRGKYVLENLLNSPPPPPPPNVPSLNTAGAGSGETLTMREAMLKHRANPACASCHARMDPIGFALENFDAVGRWRNDDGGKPIDVVSALPDGRKIEGVDGVRQMILAHPDQLVEAMTSKLLMYALGRNVQYYDGPAVRAIARESASHNYTFAAQVLGIANSVPFQNRVVRSPKVNAAQQNEGK
jgi:mono/diheme cytochrome c family protein